MKSWAMIIMAIISLNTYGEIFEQKPINPCNENQKAVCEPICIQKTVYYPPYYGTFDEENNFKIIDNYRPDSLECSWKCECYLKKEVK